MKPSPCKDCKNRVVGCHSYCEDYLEFQHHAEDIRNNRQKHRVISNLIYDSIVRDKDRSHTLGRR